MFLHLLNLIEALIACQKGLLANSLNYELWELLGNTYQNLQCYHRAQQCWHMLERLMATQNTQSHSYYKKYYQNKLSQEKLKVNNNNNGEDNSVLDFEITVFVEKVLSNLSIDENAPLTSDDAEQEQDPSAL